MSDMPDLSAIFQMMSDKNIDFSAFTHNNASDDSQRQADVHSSSNPSSPDMETMLKMAKLMSSLNSTKNSASTNLLYALKPFLRDSKKEKVDQYANLLKITSLWNEMNQSGGDLK